MKVIIALFCLAFSVNPTFAQQPGNEEKLFSTKQLQEDLQFARHKLESNHPDLYLYSSKETIDQLFDSLFSAITHPMHVLEFYRHLSIISSVIKDGHTVMLPGEAILKYHNQNSKFLPYKFILIDNKLYVDQVCTSDNSILRGAEILSINNESAAQITEQLMSRLVRDGNNLSYPQWILDNYFKSYYSFSFGHPKSFSIAYHQEQADHSATINALSNDSIAYYRKIKYPDHTNEKKPYEGITLKIAEENKYAVLTIRDFHNDILRKEYRQNFFPVIENYFNRIKANEIDHLVLDLRDNQGGDLPNGVELLSYLLDKPFSVLDGYFELSHAHGGYQLQKSSGESLGAHQPKRNVYLGKLFVLINGGSFSNSGIVSACLKRNNRAIFIGEETGGSNKVLAGDANEIHLPNTGIRIDVPSKRFLLDENLPLTGRGTLPDYPVVFTVEDLQRDEDVVMKFVVQMILGKK